MFNRVCGLCPSGHQSPLLDRSVAVSPKTASRHSKKRSPLPEACALYGQGDYVTVEAYNTLHHMHLRGLITASGEPLVQQEGIAEPVWKLCCHSLQKYKSLELQCAQIIHSCNSDRCPPHFRWSVTPLSPTSVLVLALILRVSRSRSAGALLGFGSGNSSVLVGLGVLRSYVGMGAAAVACALRDAPAALRSSSCSASSRSVIDTSAPRWPCLAESCAFKAGTACVVLRSCAASASQPVRLLL